MVLFEMAQNVHDFQRHCKSLYFRRKISTQISEFPMKQKFS